MKIASLISGTLIVAIMILFFSGTLDFDNGINESIINGNKSYAASNYDQALETYKKGLGESSEDPRLNYNSGQASYRLSNYEDAVKYYAKASETHDKYINSGNSSVKLAEITEDSTKKQQYYQQALETFKNGIIAFPENVPLKYNFEYVKSKLGDGQSNNSEDQNKNEENNDSQENKQDGQDENQQQNQQNTDSQQDKQNESSEPKDAEEKNGEKSENQQSSQSGKSKEQDKTQGEEKEKQNASQIEESDSSNSEQSDNNIAQVLKMLEKQEEESLKNNQEVQGNAKEDEYDW